jgi:hypothetical protein
VDNDGAVLLRFAAYLEGQLARLGVDVRRNLTATAALVRDLAPEAVVLATGASYRRPLGWLVPRVVESTGAPRWPPQPTNARNPWRSSIPRYFDGLLERLVSGSALRRPNAALARELAAAGVEAHLVGDCRRPGRTPEAVLDAAEVACRL